MKLAIPKIKKNIIFTEGHFYSLQEIGEISARLKMISSRKSETGFFYLYKDIQTGLIWISGPLQQSSQVLFFLMGAKPIKGQLEKYFIAEVRSMIGDLILKSIDLFQSREEGFNEKNQRIK